MSKQSGKTLGKDAGGGIAGGSFELELVQQTSDWAKRYTELDKPSRAKYSWSEDKEREFLSIPVEKLIDDPYFFGQKNKLYPCHKDDILELWEAREKDNVHTAAFIEAVGSGKTHKAGLILGLLVYELLCLVNPREHFGLDKGSLALICQSRDADKARDVTFKTTYEFFDCPFFLDYFPPSISFAKVREGLRKPKELRFPKGVVLFPGSGSEASALGYNIYGGSIDEANFMAVIEDSKRVRHTREYSAAELSYEYLFSRHESRFRRQDGSVPGLIVMYSAVNYEGDFLEAIAHQAETDKKIFVRRRNFWDAKPGLFSGKTTKFDTERLKFVK